MTEPTETAPEVHRIRRLTAETAAESAYTDAMIQDMLDQNKGNIYRTAADICTEKAAAAADQYDFSADGGSYSRSQVSEKWARLAEKYAYYAGKKSGGTIRLIKDPREKVTRNVLCE